MRAIRKYSLSLLEEGNEIIMLPDGAEILHIGEELKRICLWAQVDLEALETKAYIRVIDTEQVVPEELFEDLIYLGSLYFLSKMRHVYLRNYL